MGRKGVAAGMLGMLAGASALMSYMSTNTRNLWIEQGASTYELNNISAITYFGFGVTAVIAGLAIKYAIDDRREKKLSKNQ